MNVTQLTSPPHYDFQRISKDAVEKDADFLALRLLNKRSRLRLSPEPIQLDPLPSKGCLFAIANSQGWFAAAVCDSDASNSLILSTLPELRSALTSSSSTESASIFKPRLSVPLPGTPHILVFTQDSSRLLIALTNGSIIVFDSHAIFQGSPPSPVHTFPSSGSKALCDLLPCTGDTHHVAVLRTPGDGLAVEILDVQAMTSLGGWTAGGTPNTNPVSLSWSPKGKQIAIGLESGDIITYSPTDTSTPKSFVPRPPSAGSQSIISTTWLSNTEFHGIYAPPGVLNPDAEQTHYIISLDSKTNAVGDVKLTTPYMPFPGLRPPGSFMVTLRQWDPSRLLLFIADSTSSDVGLIGSLSEAASPLASWYNFSLEETSTPSVPLDADMNETVLLGLDLDLTSAEPLGYTGPSGEETDVPPPPAMYLYANDGTITAWHVIQTQGAPYPGMGGKSTSVSTSPMVMPAQASTPAVSQTPFGSSVQPAQSAFGSSAQPAQNAFGTSAPSGPSAGGAFGFSAFSGQTSAFGKSSFGFGSQQPSTSLSPPTAPALSTPSISVDMTSATDDSMAPESSAFGGMSMGLGGEPKSTANANSMFGSFENTNQQPSSSPFGAPATNSSTFSTFGAGPIKPGTGFGAFSGNAPSAFGSSGGFGGGAFSSGGGAFSGGAFSNSGSTFGATPSTDNTTANASTTTEAKPASGFGQPGFGSSPAKPAFGQSSFGKPAFGQSSFGQPAFGQSSFGAAAKPATPSGSTASSGGGFAAFASAAPTSFATAAQKPAGSDAKPVWSSSSSQQEPKSVDNNTSAVNAFGSTVTAPPASGGAFGGLAQSSQNSAFGKTAFGQPTFGQSAFSQPAASTSNPIKPGSGAFASGGFAGFANAGPSAFSAAAQQSSSSDAKPVWGVSDKPTSSEPPKSAFGAFGANNTTSAFGSGGLTASTPSATPSTPTSPAPSPAKPAFAAATPPATPPVKSSADEKPSTPAPATTTPAAAPPTGGAFANLATSSSGFSKLQPGFGAFSATTTTPSSSPFFQKPGTTPTSSSSFFGQSPVGSTTPASKEGSSTPTFGSASFGSPASTSVFGKPSFGSPSPFGAAAGGTTPASTSATGAVKSAFSAFSGSSSPFGAAASGSSGKSFGDLLRKKDGEEDADKDAPKAQGFSRTAEAWAKPVAKPVSAFAALKDRASTTPDKGKGVEEEEEGEGDYDEEADETFRDDDDGSEEGDDGIDAFLKSDEEDLGSDEEDGPVPSAQTPPESPTVKQVPSSAKPSAPIFGGIFGGSTLAETKKDEPTKVSPIRAGSTTPPGSPSDQEPVVAKVFSATIDRASSAPPTTTPSTSFLAAGKPSTRPVRSSPLANRPISGDDEEDEEDAPEASPSATKKARSASPAIPAAASSLSRPKTPPSLFGAPPAPPKPAPFTLTPSPTPPAKSASPVPDKPTSTTPSLTGPSTSTPSTASGGLLGKLPPPVFTPPAPPTGGLFGSKPALPSGGLFGQVPPVTPSPSQPFSVPSTSTSLPGGSLFSKLPPPPSAASASAASSPTTPGLFGQTVGKPSPFGTATTPSPSVGASSVPSKPQPRPPPTPARDIQSEFANLYEGLNRDLAELKELAKHAASRTVAIGKPSNGVKTVEDIEDASKWIINDLPQLKQIMKEVDGELQKWKDANATIVSELREVESDMLKASTRKEEIERFSKASTDADFARMQKSRVLSPDYLEAQSKLRRDVRTMRSRIQQLEDYIQASKKKLSSVKTGKATFKPPSLDTINRTYRNIDTFIEQGELDVYNLANRVASLEISGKSLSSPRDKRLPDRQLKREVTPNIAASTAATLNAERSAQKLKRALLNTRQPFLNTKAVDAVPPEKPPRPRRAPLLSSDSSLGVGGAFAAGLTTGDLLTWSGPSRLAAPSWMPPFELDASGSSPTTGLSSGRSRGVREKQHAKPIPLGQKPPPPPPPAGFSWGPVPVIQPKSTISIFAELGSKKGKAKEEGGLGDSWVADGFGDAKR